MRNINGFGSAGPDGRIWKTAYITPASCIALCLLLLDIPVQGASGTTTISPSTAAGIGLAAAANYKVTQDSQWKDYEDVVIVAALNGINKAAANNGQVLTTATYTSVANQLRAWLNMKSPQYPIFTDEAACLRYGIDSMVPVVNASPASPLLPGVLNGLENLKLTQLEIPIDPTRQYPADLGSSSISKTAYQFIGDRIQEASDLAHNDIQFAAAVNSVLSDLLGIDSGASYAQIQNLYPSALPTLPTPNSDGSYTINTASLLSQYKSVVSSAQAILDADLTSLGSQSSNSSASATSSVGARMKTSASGSALTCATANPLSLTILTNICIFSPSNKTDPWTPLQSDVTGISKFIGLENSGLANQVATIGGGIVQAGKTIDQIANLAGATGSIFGDLAPILGVLNPVGAIAGAAVQVFSMFGAGNANPDAVVLAQIQKLSQQITKLQQDMDAQFNQINATLNTILNTIGRDFTLLSGDVHALQVGLLDLQTQLNQLQVYSLAYTQTQEYETLVQYLNGCLNYRTIHNGADIGLSQYNTCENELFTWANNNVTDQLWAGVQQPNYSDANIYNIFLNNSVTGVCSGCASPFSTDVNYVAQFPAQNLSLPALSNVRLPNPELWTLVARAYLQLAEEWPQYASMINSVHFDNLIQVGTSLQQAIHKANSTGTSGSIATNQSLFNAVVSKYNTAITSLQNAIQSLFGIYTSNPPLSGINLWGGTSQSISHTPPANRIPAWCDGTPIFSGLAVPDGNMFTDKYFSSGQRAPFVLGEYLGLGTIDYCIDAFFENGTNKRNGSGNADVAIFARFNGASFVQFYKRLQVWQANSGNNQQNLMPPGTDLYNFVPNNWQSCQYTSVCIASTCGYLAQFQGTATVCGGPGPLPVNTVYPYDATAVQTVINGVTSRLSSYQSALYGQVSSSFSADATPIQVSGQFLSGAKVLAQAYANFGLPGLLQTNDALHGLLYGNSAIVDRSTVQSDFAAFSNSISNITDNKITDEIALLNSRSAELAAAFTAALSQVQQSGVPDSLAQVDTTLEDLQAFETLKNAFALSACTYQLSAPSGNFALGGGSITLTATSVNNCILTPSTGASWLTVRTQSLGSGQFQITLNATPDSGGSRSGVVIIGDLVYRVFQGIAIPNDLDNDGHADLVWQQDTTNASYVWYMGGTDGSVFRSAKSLSGPEPGWRVVGVADLDNDGHADLVWQQDTTNASYVWYMGGTDGSVFRSAKSLSGPEPGWRVVAVADLDNDGHADLVWQQDTTNASYVWYMGGTDGSVFLGAKPLSGSETGWKIVGVADLDNDGHSDLIWQQDSTNASYVWYMAGTDGSVFLSAKPLSGSETGWKIVGVADLDNDGHSDLIWQQDSTNASYVWYMGGTDGSVFLSAKPLSGPEAGWRIVGPK